MNNAESLDGSIILSINEEAPDIAYEREMERARGFGGGLFDNSKNLPTAESEIDKTKAVMIPIDELSDFKNHPFRVIEDKKLEALSFSIKELGILHPLVVRKAGG